MNWPRLSQSLALLAAGLGALCLTGWVLDIGALKRLHAGWVSMKANTALCLILAGIAVALIRDVNCLRWKRKDGTIRSVLIHSSVYRENGHFIHTRCFTRDVTGCKSAEAAREQLAAIVGSSEDSIVSKNLDGVVTSWNAGAGRLFGYTAAEMIGQPMIRLFPADRSSEEEFILQRLREGGQIPTTTPSAARGTGV